MISAVHLCLVLPLVTSGYGPEDPRSSPDRVDPWDLETGRDIHILDRTLRLAQRDMKYFQGEKEPWERPDPGEDFVPGFNYSEWEKTYIRPPTGLGDKQTMELMKKSMVPEFDISKIKLKPDKKNNASVIFGVIMRPGPENKIIGYSSKRLHVQIHAPSYQGAADNELARFLSKVLAIPRKLIKIKQGAGQNIRKVRIPKEAVQKKVFIQKLIKEFGLEKVTEKTFDA
uniref:Uncharacterized protein n=1 Tax=Graphocephala atropunctata TaxID=36148 RepID=A0A1B6KS96_9HEMI